MPISDKPAHLSFIIGDGLYPEGISCSINPLRTPVVQGYVCAVLCVIDNKEDWIQVGLSYNESTSSHLYVQTSKDFPSRGRILDRITPDDVFHPFNVDLIRSKSGWVARYNGRVISEPTPIVDAVPALAVETSHCSNEFTFLFSHILEYRAKGWREPNNMQWETFPDPSIEMSGSIEAGVLIRTPIRVA